MAVNPTIPWAAEVWFNPNATVALEKAQVLHPCLGEERDKLADQNFVSKKVFRYRPGGHNEALFAAALLCNKLRGIKPEGLASSTPSISRSGMPSWISWLWSWIPGLRS